MVDRHINFVIAIGEFLAVEIFTTQFRTGTEAHQNLVPNNVPLWLGRIAAIGARGDNGRIGQHHDQENESGP